MATPHRPRASTITSNHLRLIASKDLTIPKDITATLTNALESRDYSICLKNLHGIGIDPQSYIDGLDKAIGIISSGSDIHGRCVRALSRACKIYGLLPASHEVTSLLTTSQYAIASGRFSDIWKATNANGEVFALKVLRMYEGSAVQVKKKYCREVIRSRWMNHPNVLRIEGVAPDLFPCCTVSRWMENGNMLEYLNTHQGHIDRSELLLGIMRGLNHLHARNVVHGDLRSHNIFINAQGIPCLANFGLSSIARDIYSVNGSDISSGGSVRWSAPELVGPITTKNEVWVKPTVRSDIYSLAMVIVEAFTGRVPFPNLSDAYVVISIMKGVRPQKPSNGESRGLGPAIWKLTEDCWNQNREKRPDIASVLRRFQAIFCAGEEKRSSPIIERIKSIGLPFDSVQQRINKLDQELEKAMRHAQVDP
ncbi:kinase-like domain-containing protein [Thelephora terrestris]|uniref:Kinase-like domain-containing protein n=1 Tax=Thelephora terrestris TaxID=56493 RepID=A0A9P6HMF2_9AGAM|nr:kinase-like domain-containing protein [Thelephora terrestris]